MTAHEIRVYEFETRDIDQSERTMTGMVVPYGKSADIGSFTEEIAPGAFKKSYTEAHKRKTNPGVPLLGFHNRDDFPIGVSTHFEESPEGLFGTFRFAKTEAGHQAYEQVRDGTISGLSVGFQSFDHEIRRDAVPHVIRKQARLAEVSLVPAPSYDDARVLLVRTAFTDEPAPTPGLDQARKFLEEVRSASWLSEV